MKNWHILVGALINAVLALLSGWLYTELYGEHAFTAGVVQWWGIALLIAIWSRG